MMQLPLLTKIRIGLYIGKSLLTKPTFGKFDPYDSVGFYADPNPVLAEMLRAHRVFFCPKIAAWVVSLDRAGTFALAKDARFSVSFHDWRFTPKPLPDARKSELDRILSKLLMSLDDADHLRVRRLVQPAFHPRTIASMESAIQRIVNESLDKIDGEFNLVEVSKAIPLRVIAALVGIPVGFHAEFAGLAKAIMATYMPTETPDLALADAGIRIVRQIIEERRTSPNGDFISVLVQMADEQGDKLSVEEVMAFVASLLAAGPDTTAQYLNLGVYGLLKNRQVIPQLLENPELIGNALIESGRIDYFAHSGGIRFAREDVVIEAQKIEKGEMIKVNVNTANLDATVFADPLKFDLHRRNFNEVWNFGAGKHFCVGAALAKSIGRNFIHAFIHRFPNAELAAEPRYERDFIARKMTSMMIAPGLRASAGPA